MAAAPGAKMSQRMTLFTFESSQETSMKMPKARTLPSRRLAIAPFCASLPVCTLIFCLMGDSLAHAAEHWFAISSNADFADVRAQLHVVVDEHAHQKQNRFCVVGEGASGDDEAWVYWPQENKLILWLPDRDNPHAIAGSKRYLDLSRDVVAGNDVNGSTYLMTRQTVREKIQACRQHGEVYSVDKPASGAGRG
jgi:hypothetical protein